MFATLIALSLGAFGPNTNSLECITCIPSNCPQNSVTVCQGSQITKITIRCDVPGGFIAKIISVPKTSTDSISSPCLCVSPNGQWGDVVSCTSLSGLCGPCPQ